MQMPNLYTVNLIIENRLCLVVGGGKVAARKTLSLIECGAVVKAVSSCFCDTFLDLGEKGIVQLLHRPFKDEDLKDVFLVICATDSETINSQVSQICHQNNTLVNVVDDPAKCSFFVPSVLRRGDLSIAISTKGQSPALASKIKQDLSIQYGDEYERYLKILGSARQKILNDIKNPLKRREILIKLLDFDLYDLISMEEDGRLKEWIDTCSS